MRLFFLIAVFSLSSLAGPSAGASQNKEKASFWSSLFKGGKKSPTQRKKSKKFQPKKVSRKVLSKEDILTKSYYQPQKTRKKLMAEFNMWLERLESLCRSSNMDRPMQFNKIIQNFELFLKSGLKDPYIFYDLKMLFRDILELVERESPTASLSLEGFSESYRQIYNLPEDIKSENYPHEWAKAIHHGLECAFKLELRDKKINPNEQEI